MKRAKRGRKECFRTMFASLDCLENKGETREESNEAEIAKTTR